MIKAAILIDGGYFLKRLPHLNLNIDPKDASSVANSINQLVNGHLKKLNLTYQCSNEYQLLYRTFYYDAPPYDKMAQTPINRDPINYADTDTAKFRRDLFGELKRMRNLAIRLGELRMQKNQPWLLKLSSQQKLLDGDLGVSQLSDSDFVPAFRQKGVDMRIGLDIASITLKRLANVIVLVTGDSDFVPAAKFARREGVHLILDPLWQEIPPELSEHIDHLTSGFVNPRRNTANQDSG